MKEISTGIPQLKNEVKSLTELNEFKVEKRRDFQC